MRLGGCLLLEELLQKLLTFDPCLATIMLEGIFMAHGEEVLGIVYVDLVSEGRGILGHTNHLMFKAAVQEDGCLVEPLHAGEEDNN